MICMADQHTIHPGLQRCGKSCRLRWTNYLRPDLKRGQFSEAEEQTIVKIHSVLGNRWSIIASQLPGRTDNDVKNYWNTKLKKKLTGVGIDPVTHKPFSHLMAEIATTLAPPQVARLAEAALGCFKDEMLHLLTKKHIDCQLQQSSRSPGNTSAPFVAVKHGDNDDTIEKIKLGLSKAMHEPDMQPPNKTWDSANAESASFAGVCSRYPASINEFQCGSSSFVTERDESPWGQNMCAGGRCMPDDRESQLHEKLENEKRVEYEGGKEIRNGCDIFTTDTMLWDLPSDDLLNPIV